MCGILKEELQYLKCQYYDLAYASLSWPYMSAERMLNLATEIKIVDNVTYKNADLEVCFTAAISNPKTKLKNKNGLCRAEFLEVLVRIAYDRFYKTKEVKTVAEGLRLLINDYIKPNVVPDVFVQGEVPMLWQWQGWREEVLWTLEVNDVLSANLQSIKLLFNRYISEHNGHKIVKQQDAA